MITTIALKLEGNRLSKKGIFSLTKHCAGWPILTVSFPKECEELSAYAVFEADTGSTCAVPLIEGACEVPWEITDAADQEVYVGIYASKTEGVLLALSSNKVTFPVDEGTDPAALTPPKTATPNAFEVLRDDVDGLELRVKALEKENISGTGGIGIASAAINEGGELVLTFSDESTVNLGVVVGANGKDGVNGIDGKDGVDGIGVSAAEINSDGELVLTYTNGQCSNLGKVIGANGADGKDGKDGVSPTIEVTELAYGSLIDITDKNGKKTVRVANGADGVACTHSWNGTALTVTSASGTTSADLKGEKGDKGDPYTLTDEDKAAIASEVLAALPAAEGVAF